MKLVITGSLGNISRPLVIQLVSAGHQVSVISANPERRTAITGLGAKALIGSLSDAAFVSKSFEDAAAVYTMVPPDFSQPDCYHFAEQVHRSYANAIEKNGIRQVVNLSSIVVAGAGKPPLERFYDLEAKINDIPGINVVHLRPAMFCTNFYGSIGMIKGQGIIGHNLPGDTDLLMTHPRDIARLAFEILNRGEINDQQIEYVISDILNGNEVARLIGDAIAKPLGWVQFPDEALLAGLLGNGFSKDAAETLVINAGKAIREGVFDTFKAPEYQLKTRTTFREFAVELAGML